MPFLIIKSNSQASTKITCVAMVIYGQMVKMKVRGRFINKKWFLQLQKVGVR